MSRILGNVALCLLTAGLITGCASQKPLYPPQEVAEGTWAPKVDQFEIILDRSMSTYHRFEGIDKATIVMDYGRGLNQSIPEMGYDGALRAFGTGPCVPGDAKTHRVYGLEEYATDGLAHGLDQLGCVGGPSRLDLALEAAGEDLGGPDEGPSAIVVVSDGMHMDERAVDAAMALAEQYGDALCVYCVLIGDSEGGKSILARVAKASSCGFTVLATDQRDADQLQGFVREVFLEPDSDGDGVGDSRDRCPNTPKGIEVDEHGCPPDSDGDGVPDHLDECPGTPRGVQVDARGCPLDSDGDGVPDYKDACPNTPRGVAVDARGCPLDDDGDGVPNYLDECPGTPPGTPVDEVGCPRVWTVSGDVLFDFDRSEIRSDAIPVLDDIATYLSEHPGVAMEIQGHTDAIGTPEYNLGLSERRAEAAKAYLVGRGVDGARLTTVGFGLERPVVDNNTVASRALNRRVELVVLN